MTPAAPATPDEALDPSLRMGAGPWTVQALARRGPLLPGPASFTAILDKIFAALASFLKAPQLLGADKSVNARR